MIPANVKHWHGAKKDSWFSHIDVYKRQVMINVYGGGYTGQAGAMRHGITRALMECNEDYRPVLKACLLYTSRCV